MKRDLELIKKILLDIESNKDELRQNVVIEGFTREEINYHMAILVDANYIEASVSGYGRVFPKRLTWIGHDFLDAARNDTIWNKANAFVKKKGLTVSIDIMKTVLVKMIQDKLEGN